MNEITNKTIVVQVGGDRFWITPEQASILKESVKQGANFVEVDDMFIKSNFISYIAPASEVDRAIKVKKGQWQCEDCGRWHQKGEQCGCNGGKY